MGKRRESPPWAMREEVLARQDAEEMLSVALDRCGGWLLSDLISLLRKSFLKTGGDMQSPTLRWREIGIGMRSAFSSQRSETAKLDPHSLREPSAYRSLISCMNCAVLLDRQGARRLCRYQVFTSV